MRGRLFLLLLALILAGAVVLILFPVFRLPASKVTVRDGATPRPLPVVTPQALLPPPLRPERKAELATDLTVAGILEATNEERRLQGVPPLALQPLLTRAAEQKLADMFDREYFAHLSPLGMHPADVVRATGYRFLLVGENLALGSFQSDRQLVQAWMESPGHRRNILKPQFTEIGIAVGQGEFEGRRVWIAVQTFAAPVSACPAPDPVLLQEIELNRTTLQQAQDRLQELAAALNRGDDEFNNSSLDEFNQVDQSREELAAINEEHVRRYNQEVQEYNHCLEAMTGAAE